MSVADPALRKRIAIIVYGGIGGGLADQGQPAIMQLTEALASKFDIHVFSYCRPGDGFKPKGYKFFTATERIESNVSRWFSIIKHVYICHRANRFNVVYAFWGYPAGVVAFLVAKLLRLPSVIHLQGGDSVGLRLPGLKYGVFTNPFRRMICKYVFLRATAIIALSKFQAKHLVALGMKREIEVIPFGVEDRFFAYQPRQHGMAFTFLMIGNLTPVKNQKFALRTFKEIASQTNASLVIVGADYLNQELQKLATELSLGDRVEFKGPQLYTDVGEFYRDADVLLHTSFWEGQGVVFAEAASCGTLLAGTRVGMLADMGEECGIIADDEDPKRFSRQILRVLADQHEAAKLRANAKAWVTKFDRGNMISSISKIIDRIT